jgi:hypothetical protein
MAASKMYRTEHFRGPLMRVSYAWQLFKLREDEGYRPSYGCTLIAPNDGFGPIIERVKEVVVGQWGETKGPEKWKAGLIKNPILPGDGKEARAKDTGELHPGMGEDVKFIRVTSGAERKPLIFAKDAVTRIDDPEDLPSGSWVYPVLNCFAWHNDKNGDGVGIGLEMIQLAKIATGDEILGGSGRSDPSKFFEAIKDDSGGESKPASAADLFG